MVEHIKIIYSLSRMDADDARTHNQNKHESIIAKHYITLL